MIGAPLADWRSDYVICEHVEESTPNEYLEWQKERVCCLECRDAGFLAVESLHVTVLGDLAFGRIA